MCLDGAILYFNYFSQCYNVVMVSLYVCCIDMLSSYSKSLVIMWSLSVRKEWNIYRSFARNLAKSHFLAKSEI